MRYLFVALLLSSMPLTAHAQDVDINTTDMATPTCETYVEWTGKNINDIDLSILGDRPHRILKPDSMMTMDYSPNRLNINTTDDGIILTQECG